MMTESMDIAEYMAVNYWNGLTDPSRAYPSDSLLVSGVLKSDVEQKFADWTMFLDMVPLSVADKAVGKLYDRVVACERQDTSSNVFETFTALAISSMGIRVDEESLDRQLTEADCNDRRLFAGLCDDFM